MTHPFSPGWVCMSLCVLWQWEPGLSQMPPRHEVTNVEMCLLDLGQLGTSLSLEGRAGERRKEDFIGLQQPGASLSRQEQAVSCLGGLNAQESLLMPQQTQS